MEEGRSKDPNKGGGKLYGEKIAAAVSGPTHAKSPTNKEMADLLKSVGLPEHSARPQKKEEEGSQTERSDGNANQTDEVKKAPDSKEEEGRGNQDAKEGARTGIPAIRTLRDDMHSTVHEGNMSLVRAAALEQDKRRYQPSKTEKRESRESSFSGKTRGILFATVILAVLGAGAIAGIYYASRQEESTPSLPQANDGIIFAENALLLDLSGMRPFEVKQSLESAREAASLSLGAIARIVPAAVSPESQALTPLTAQEFLLAIGANAPDSLARSLDDNFFLGVHTIDTNAPLIIFPVIAYERAFAAMLEWEEFINTDISPPFSAIPRSYRTEDGLETVSFEDIVIRNFDVRVLRDRSGTVRFLYAFPTRSILVIGESPHTFTEVLSRLQAARNF